MWAAIDEWNKAEGDSEAQSLINQYSKYLPTSQDIFMRDGVDDGGQYFVLVGFSEASQFVRVPSGDKALVSIGLYRLFLLYSAPKTIRPRNPKRFFCPEAAIYRGWFYLYRYYRRIDCVFQSGTS